MKKVNSLFNNGKYKTIIKDKITCPYCMEISNPSIQIKRYNISPLKCKSCGMVFDIEPINTGEFILGPDCELNHQNHRIHKEKGKIPYCITCGAIKNTWLLKQTG